jgi:hypothetical protein
LAFYSTVFFRDINRYRSKSLDALWLSWGLGLANFLFTFPAYWGIERLGRRFLLISTYPGMIISMFGASMSFLGGTTSEQSVRAGVFMFFFILFYSLGQGPGKSPLVYFQLISCSLGLVAFAYSSEVFPLFNREVGMSWAVFVNLFGAGLLTLFVPLFQVASTTHPGSNTTPFGNALENCTATASLDTLNIVSDSLQGETNWAVRQAKLLGTFVAFGFLSFLLIYFFVPETKVAASGKKSRRTINYISLEELNNIFKLRTRDHIRYQIFEVLPYELEILKYLIGRRKTMPKLQLPWIWAQDSDDDDSDTSEPRQTRTGSDVNRVQQEYNPGPNDWRRDDSQPQNAHQNGDGVRAVEDLEDGEQLPNPPFLRNRAGSLDWDPSEHPSPEISAPGSQVNIGHGVVELPGRPSISPVSSANNARPTKSDAPGQPRSEADDGDVDTTASQRRQALQSHPPAEHPNPQIRRKPVPQHPQSGNDAENDTGGGSGDDAVST